MAFQSKPNFFAFLQSFGIRAPLEESAPSENYILDERSSDREDDFLSFNGFESVSHLTRDAWFKHHVDYALTKVAHAAVSTTFDDTNRANWLSLQPDSDVVRIDTISGLNSRAVSAGVSDIEAHDLIRDLIAARNAGGRMDSLREARLQKWLKLVNTGSDRRPAFVAPFAEVEEILRSPNWANRLRDALGLGHIRPIAGKATPVVLIQYNLIRVHNTHFRAPAWAASPTILDDVPRTMPNPCFFPAPTRASSDGYGFTVDLDPNDPTWCRELLHSKIAYTLDDFRRIGEVTTDITDQQIAEARRIHRELLAKDLRYLPDVTS